MPPSTVDVNKEPPRRSSSSIKDSSSAGFSHNWLLWLIALFCSMIPLQAIPLYKLSASVCYSAQHWFIDVFGSTGIIMVTASMAIVVGFEVISKNGKIVPSVGIIIVLAAFCYLEYGILSVECEKQPEQNQAALFGKFLPINLISFFTMVLLGLICLTPLSNVFKKKNDVKREKLPGKNGKGNKI